MTFIRNKSNKNWTQYGRLSHWPLAKPLSLLPRIFIHWTPAYYGDIEQICVPVISDFILSVYRINNICNSWVTKLIRKGWRIQSKNWKITALQCLVMTSKAHWHSRKDLPAMSALIQLQMLESRFVPLRVIIQTSHQSFLKRNRTHTTVCTPKKYTPHGICCS